MWQGDVLFCIEGEKEIRLLDLVDYFWEDLSGNERLADLCLNLVRVLADVSL